MNSQTTPCRRALPAALLILSLLFLPDRAEARTPVTLTDTIAVPTMQCGMCEETIGRALRKLRGVGAVAADAGAKRVIVRYNPRRTSLTALRRAIARAGYDAGDQRATAAAKSALHPCCRAE